MATSTLQPPTQQLSTFVLNEILKGESPVNNTELEVFNFDPAKIAFDGLGNVVKRAIDDGAKIINLSK